MGLNHTINVAAGSLRFYRETEETARATVVCEGLTEDLHGKFEEPECRKSLTSLWGLQNMFKWSGFFDLFRITFQLHTDMYSLLKYKGISLQVCLCKKELTSRYWHCNHLKGLLRRLALSRPWGLGVKISLTEDAALFYPAWRNDVEACLFPNDPVMYPLNIILLSHEPTTF